jgi:hypothetical protein
MGDSRKCRVARAIGCSPARAEKHLYGPLALNRLCAQVVAADVQAGDYETAVAFVALIEAELAGPRQPLLQALHDAELADIEEQVAEEALRHAIQHGRATVEQAREYIRKSATARRKAEQAEQAVAQWIQDQDAIG